MTYFCSNYFDVTQLHNSHYACVEPASFASIFTLATQTQIKFGTRGKRAPKTEKPWSRPRLCRRFVQKPVETRVKKPPSAHLPIAFLREIRYVLIRFSVSIWNWSDRFPFKRVTLMLIYGYRYALAFNNMLCFALHEYLVSPTSISHS